ncbi:MAG: gluconokinase [Arthrobacter sp.]|uniref:gluconokinase n=1 Tax=Arthrobacter TaxID=1663 RepID=UPI002655A9A9|nr:gluconokinase [Micrococcaceae bacterium]MDN5812209.1 gluconokinase [Micrococcaceae bacterium]MDN5824236.1 gluconokinase [Micrococcaceae bacterium]MDN5879623.1 gluconokinase [Micrococcaceae bacterium]MDN5885708.1 gluconokinase [Micrococcaceae bacterium]
MPLQAPQPPPTHLVVMGVSASGKTTLASLLADRLGWPMAEADDFHPATNVAKMASGTPLTDDDRWPWLAVLRDWMDHTPGPGTVMTCSALKRSYRDLLREADGVVRFVHVVVDPDILAERIRERTGHFMPGTLLPSQLNTLEPLESDEDGFTLANDSSAEDLLARALSSLDLDPKNPTEQ